MSKFAIIYLFDNTSPVTGRNLFLFKLSWMEIQLSYIFFRVRTFKQLKVHVSSLEGSGGAFFFFVKNYIQKNAIRYFFC